MTQPGVIELRDVAPPSPGPGQVLMRVQRIGVCGSDVHVYHGDHPFTPYPVVQGHEFSALVEAVGEGVAGLAPGQKVTATPQETCGVCRACRRGDYHICDGLKVRGFQAPGVAQDLAVTEADKIVPLPETFTFEQGAFVEPVAVSVHATGRAGDLKGRNVVVLGTGPIGNFVSQACRCRGAAKVLVTDLSDFRLDLALQCGAQAVSRADTEPLTDAARRAFGNEGFDVAFECAGSEKAVAGAIEAIDKGGTVLVLGVFGQRPRIDMASVCEHELRLVGSLMYRRPDYVQAVEWIAAGQVRTEPLDSRHFPLEEYLEAYRFIDSSGPESMKVFIDL